MDFGAGSLLQGTVKLGLLIKQLKDQQAENRRELEDLYELVSSLQRRFERPSSDPLTQSDVRDAFASAITRIYKDMFDLFRRNSTPALRSRVLAISSADDVKVKIQLADQSLRRWLSSLQAENSDFMVQLLKSMTYDPRKVVKYEPACRWWGEHFPQKQEVSINLFHDAVKTSFVQYFRNPDMWLPVWELLQEAVDENSDNTVTIYEYHQLCVEKTLDVIIQELLIYVEETKYGSVDLFVDKLDKDFWRMFFGNQSIKVTKLDLLACCRMYYGLEKAKKIGAMLGSSSFVDVKSFADIVNSSEIDLLQHELNSVFYVGMNSWIHQYEWEDSHGCFVVKNNWSTRLPVSSKRCCVSIVCDQLSTVYAACSGSVFKLNSCGQFIWQISPNFLANARNCSAIFDSEGNVVVAGNFFVVVIDKISATVLRKWDISCKKGIFSSLKQNFPNIQQFGCALLDARDMLFVGSQGKIVAIDKRHQVVFADEISRGRLAADKAPIHSTSLCSTPASPFLVAAVNGALAFINVETKESPKQINFKNLACVSLCALDSVVYAAFPMSSLKMMVKAFSIDTQEAKWESILNFHTVGAFTVSLALVPELPTVLFAAGGGYVVQLDIFTGAMASKVINLPAALGNTTFTPLQRSETLLPAVVGCNGHLFVIDCEKMEIIYSDPFRFKGGGSVSCASWKYSTDINATCYVHPWL